MGTPVSLILIFATILLTGKSFVEIIYQVLAQNDNVRIFGKRNFFL